VRTARGVGVAGAAMAVGDAGLISPGDDDGPALTACGVDVAATGASVGAEVNVVEGPAATSVADAVGVGDGVPVASGSAITVRPGVAEGTSEGVAVAVGLAVGLRVWVGDGVAVAVAVGLAVGRRVWVGEGVGVGSRPMAYTWPS